MIEEIRCIFCGKLSNKSGGNQFIGIHHAQGRNQSDSEDKKEKLPLCQEHHDISECRGWYNLPFTDYKIQGKLFDEYIKTGDIEYIISYIDQGKYSELWEII